MPMGSPVAGDNYREEKEPVTNASGKSERIAALPRNRISFSAASNKQGKQRQHNSNNKERTWKPWSRETWTCKWNV